MLRPHDRPEVAEIAASVREAMPAYRASFEIAIERLAWCLWRQRRADAHLATDHVRALFPTAHATSGHARMLPYEVFPDAPGRI
jgi:hypothetical protein